LPRKEEQDAPGKKTQSPENKSKFNQLNNILNHQLQDLRNASFEKYITNLSRQDKYIWKPMRNKRKLTTVISPIRKYTTPPPSNWARSDYEKAELFAEHLQEVFTPPGQPTTTRSRFSPQRSHTKPSTIKGFYAKRDPSSKNCYMYTTPPLD
jgi:hypothetical protein